MTTTASKLDTRFREVILNGTWIANTNFKDQLDGMIEHSYYHLGQIVLIRKLLQSGD